MVEVFSPDEQVFSVTENGSNTTKYDSREEFLKDFSALKEWLWGVVE